MTGAQNDLDALLLSVIKENPDRVVGWMREEAGCWGFLAGKAVRACREQKGEALTDPERRVVWHRLWQLLTELKEQIPS